MNLTEDYYTLCEYTDPTGNIIPILLRRSSEGNQTDVETPEGRRYSPGSYMYSRFRVLRKSLRKKINENTKTNYLL